MTPITSFDTLLTAAKEQDEPQRFLFVFLKTVLPKDATASEKNRFQQGDGGELEAVMCVDKAQSELSDFSALVAESKQVSEDWQMVLVGCMSGKAGVEPSAHEAIQPLTMMAKTVQNGGDLSRFMAFNREGIPLQFA